VRVHYKQENLPDVQIDLSFAWLETSNVMIYHDKHTQNDIVIVRTEHGHYDELHLFPLSDSFAEILPPPAGYFLNFENLEVKSKENLHNYDYIRLSRTVFVNSTAIYHYYGNSVPVIQILSTESLSESQISHLKKNTELYTVDLSLIMVQTGDLEDVILVHELQQFMMVAFKLQELPTLQIAEVSSKLIEQNQYFSLYDLLATPSPIELWVIPEDQILDVLKIQHGVQCLAVPHTKIINCCVDVPHHIHLVNVTTRIIHHYEKLDIKEIHNYIDSYEKPKKIYLEFPPHGHEKWHKEVNLTFSHLIRKNLTLEVEARNQSLDLAFLNFTNHTRWTPAVPFTNVTVHPHEHNVTYWHNRTEIVPNDTIPLNYTVPEEYFNASRRNETVEVKPEIIPVHVPGKNITKNWTLEGNETHLYLNGTRNESIDLNKTDFEGEITFNCTNHTHWKNDGEIEVTHHEGDHWVIGRKNVSIHVNESHSNYTFDKERLNVTIGHEDLNFTVPNKTLNLTSNITYSVVTKNIEPPHHMLEGFIFDNKTYIDLVKYWPTYEIENITTTVIINITGPLVYLNVTEIVLNKTRENVTVQFENSTVHVVDINKYYNITKDIIPVTPIVEEEHDHNVTKRPFNLSIIEIEIRRNVTIEHNMTVIEIERIQIPANATYLNTSLVHNLTRNGHHYEVIVHQHNVTVEEGKIRRERKNITVLETEPKLYITN